MHITAAAILVRDFGYRTRTIRNIPYFLIGNDGVQVHELMVDGVSP